MESLKPLSNINYVIIFLTIVALDNLTVTNANLIEIEYPKGTHQTVPNTYEFVPMATIIGFVFIAVCFTLLAVAKIMFASTDQYMMNNRYDLVIFKPPTNKSVLGPRRVYSNTAVNAHNLAAAQACGFDISMLNGRNPYTSFLTNLSISNGMNSKIN
jgi:hypothetical protein